MGAADRFKGANTKFSERGEYLVPIMKDVEVTDTLGAKKIASVYDRPANFTLKIKRCIWKTSREKKDFFIAEFDVVASDNPKVPVGASRTWMQNMDGDVGESAVPAFMFACLGLDRRDAKDLAEIKKIEADQELPGMLAATLEDPTDTACENSLKDLFVDVEVKEIETKKNKTPFNAHTFIVSKKKAAA
jgi:hypothetical protein